MSFLHYYKKLLKCKLPFSALSYKYNLHSMQLTCLACYPCVWTMYKREIIFPLLVLFQFLSFISFSLYSFASFVLI